jgi:hypothetical protein
MKELLRKDFPENFRGGNLGHCRFCKLLDKTETLVESGARRFKGTEAKANPVPAATRQITRWAVRVNRVEKWVNRRTLAGFRGVNRGESTTSRRQNRYLDSCSNV